MRADQADRRSLDGPSPGRPGAPARSGQRGALFDAVLFDRDGTLVAINGPVRRWRVTRTDLLPRFAGVAPVDVFGMAAADLPGRLGPPADRLGVYDDPSQGQMHAEDDPSQGQMHAEMARRRAYLHPHRWTSPGLGLLEAMTMGMPVIVLASTEAVAAVPAEAGVLSTNVDTLVDAAQWLLDEPQAALRLGASARRAALARYGPDRFLAGWDRLLEEETCVSR